MAGHLTPDEVMLSAEGLLPPSQSQQIAEHLSDCPECRENEQRWLSMSVSLTSFAEETVPPEVSLRLQRAVVDEAAYRAAHSVSASNHATAPEVRSQRWWDDVITPSPNATQPTFLGDQSRLS